MRLYEIVNHEIDTCSVYSTRTVGPTPADPPGGVMAASCCPPDDPTRGTRGASTFTQGSLAKIRDQLHPGRE
jgi:hypothetical protein